jgi:GDSL-like Lipase/Acylhydrolase family
MTPGKTSAIAGNIVVLAVVTCLCFVAVEVCFRLIDGYRLDSLVLQVKNVPTGGRFAEPPDATRYAQKVALDRTFELAWFHTDPKDYDRSAKYKHPTDWADAIADYRPSPGEPYYVRQNFEYLYNYNYLVNFCATGAGYDQLHYFEKNPGFVYAFAAPDASFAPEFRLVQGALEGEKSNYYNNFGFRGPDITPRKSGRLIRLAFLGSSVTAAGWPFSYPEYVVHYLRLWARANNFDVDFDVLNAARAGIGTNEVASIMRYEVAPLHPDIVVWYAGGDDLNASTIVSPAPTKQSFSYHVKLRPFEQDSALLRRLYQLFKADASSEPPKPAHVLTFDLTQRDPDIRPGHPLPFSLDQQIADIRKAADATRTAGGEFFLASYTGMAKDGLRVDPARHEGLLNYLNGLYFPMTYREIREGLDFENTVYRKLARTDAYRFIDTDRYFPKDPDLFGDMYHLAAEESFRLMAWIIAQQLTPYLRKAIESGSLPKPANDPDPKAVAWASQPPIKFDMACRSKSAGALPASP